MKSKTLPVGLAAWFEEGARRFPEMVLQTARPPDIAPELGTKLDYRTLSALVREASGTLAAAGVRAGDRIALIKRNHVDVLVLAGAANRIGAVPALLSARMASADIKVVLERLRPAAIVTDEATLRAGALAGLDATAYARDVLCVDGAPAGTHAWSTLRGGPAAPATPPTWHEPMLITHTSGTTGVPKLVVQSPAIANQRMRFEKMPLLGLRIDARDRVAVCLQYTHARCVTALMLVLQQGIPVLALSEPDPTEAARLLAAFRPTVVETHPNIYLLWDPLSRDPQRPFAETRLFTNTFDAIHPATVLHMLESSGRRMPLWMQGWGQSESGAATLAVYTKWQVRRRLKRGEGLRDVGFPRFGFSRVRVLDHETGQPVRRGQVGQLHISSRSIALSYVGQEDVFHKRLSGDEWSMGDMGRKRWSGGVDLLDRHIDQVDGVKSCISVEDVLLARLPEASEVIVLGDLDNKPRVVVCTQEDQPLVPARWHEAVADLPGLGAPILLPWASVPRTGTWKVRRPLLRSQLFAPERLPTPSPNPTTKGALCMLRNTHDIAIMGASIGGATLAAVLAKRGKRVVLIDAGLHPRFAVGEATTPHTTHSLSLLAEQHDMPEISPRRLFRGALRSRCGIKRNFGFVYHHPGEQPRLPEAQLSPVPSESHLFRQDTDQHLTALAASFGVEVMQQTRVEAVTLDDTAVRLKLASGRELVASFLVDASGFQSGLNPLLGLTRCEPDLETWSCSLFTHMVGVMPFDDLFPHSFSGRFHQGTLHHVFDGGWLWIIPFNNHRNSTNPLVSVGLQLDPRKVTPPMSEQAEEFFRDFIRQFPTIERQLACARTVRPWIVGKRIQHRERQAGGLRWCRLPSNYGFIDPIYSKGLSQTFDAIRLLSHELVRTPPERLGQLGEALGLDQYYEKLIRKHDRLAAGSYISFRDPQLWRQFWLTWFSTTVADELCLMATRIGRRRGDTRGSQQSILSDHCFPEAEAYLERCFAVAQEVDQGKLSTSEATRRLSELNEQTHWMPPFARRFTQVSARPFPRLREVPETIRWLSSAAPHVRQVYRTLLSPRLAGLLV